MPSWWDSLESVNSVKGVLELIVLLAGFVTAASAVCIWALGNRASTLQGLKEQALQQRVEAAEVRLKDRHFTPEQRSKLLEVLKQKPKGGITITCLSGNAESCDFANEIGDLLRTAGWQVDGVNSAEVAMSSGRPPKGLRVFAEDFTRVPLHVVALVEALREIGFPPDGEQGRGAGVWPVELLVGIKP